MRFTVVLVAVLASVVAVQVFASGAQRAAEAATAVRVQLARDVEQIRHYDELLTMFAPLAASSRDTSYVTRHRCDPAPPDGHGTGRGHPPGALAHR